MDPTSRTPWADALLSVYLPVLLTTLAWGGTAVAGKPGPAGAPARGPPPDLLGRLPRHLPEPRPLLLGPALRPGGARGPDPPTASAISANLLAARGRRAPSRRYRRGHAPLRRGRGAGGGARAAAGGDRTAHPWRLLATVSPTAWGALGYLALAATVLAFLWWNVALRRLGPGRTAVFLNLVPLFWVLLAWLVLGERLGAGQLLGGLLAVAGLLICQGPAGWGALREALAGARLRAPRGGPPPAA